MGIMFRLRRLLPVAAFWAATAFAATPAALPTVPTPDSGAEQVQARKTAAYREVLAAFDAAMQAAPNDAGIAVARCEFIGRYTDEEYDWVESAPDDYTACSEALASRWGKEPAAQLFGLDQLWGEDLLNRGEAILKQANAWPAPMRARLLSKLSEMHAQLDHESRAGELAVQAAQLGEASRVAKAADHLASRKRYEDAARMLANAPPAKDIWEAKNRIEAALRLPDRKAALKEWQRYADAGLKVDAAVGARAQLRAGDVAAARRLLGGDEEAVSTTDQVRFDVAMASSDYRGAAKFVNLAKMDGFSQDLSRFATLATAAPSTLFTAPSMRLALLICLSILAAFLLVPGLVLLPVHYRGLWRRMKGKPAMPLFERAGLRDAWYAMAIALCAPMVAGLWVEPSATSKLLSGESIPEGAALFQIMMWGTAAGLLLSIPLFRGWSRRQLIGDRAALFAAWRVLIAWVLLIGVSVLLALVLSKTGGGAETVQTKSMDALAQGATEAYGPVVTLLLVALAVPIFEELMYRGLILGGLSRHISFGWSNVIQAALFAVSHDDPPRLPFYFIMGLLAGWLVKRTGALGPAIALHALNNLLAFSVRMMVAS
ncbi:MAG TPA: CPBP family glutamic-type intramembrane protease [Luteimonas sp.]|nr:CPBP family glutamic-type intramembrane protease [Luteimonas sp.]